MAKIQKNRIPKVPIYSSELEILVKQKDKNIRNLLFIILVWSKFNPYNVVNINEELYLLGRYARVGGWSDAIVSKLKPVTTENEETEGFLLQIRYYITELGYSRPFYRILFSEQNDEIKPAFWVKGLDCIDKFIDYCDLKYRCKVCKVELTKRVGNEQYCDNCREEGIKKAKSKRELKYYYLKKKRMKMNEIKDEDGEDGEES